MVSKVNGRVRCRTRSHVVDIDATTLIVAIGLTVAVALLWLTLVAA
jgi:hypothetical protein